MNAYWKLLWENHIQWQRSEQQNSSSSGCQSKVLLQVVATLGIHTWWQVLLSIFRCAYCCGPRQTTSLVDHERSLLSWTATARTRESAQKYFPPIDLSLVNQCVQIKLGSWAQPTALVHSELCLPTQTWHATHATRRSTAQAFSYAMP